MATKKAAKAAGEAVRSSVKATAVRLTTYDEVFAGPDAKLPGKLLSRTLIEQGETMVCRGFLWEAHDLHPSKKVVRFARPLHVDREATGQKRAMKFAAADLVAVKDGGFVAVLKDERNYALMTRPRKQAAYIMGAFERMEDEFADVGAFIYAPGMLFPTPAGGISIGTKPAADNGGEG